MALGWVADRSDLDVPVSVAVVVDGEIAAEGIADIARPDLASLELGGGAHGFMVALPERLQTPARHHILVLAGPELTPIPAAPSFWHRPSLDGSWSDVVFEPGGSLSARVPAPPTPQERRALIAKGWLCDADEMAAHGPLTEDRIDRIATTLAANANACAALGIGYVSALIPRKRDVLSGAPAGERSWVSELSARLRDHDHVELLDLLPVLRDAARYGAAYHRTDADWNARGAFFAARGLLKEAHKRVPALRPPPLTDLHLRQVSAYRGTLADVPKVQAVGGRLVPCELEVEAEHGVVIDSSELHALRMPIERHLAEADSIHLRVYATPEQDDHARLALIGDSAALALAPWLAERTSRTTFFWTDRLPLVQLELELPPVVLHLVREADLHSGSLWGGERSTGATFDSTALSAPARPRPSVSSHTSPSAAATNGITPAAQSTPTPSQPADTNPPPPAAERASDSKRSAPAANHSLEASSPPLPVPPPAHEPPPAQDPQPVPAANGSNAAVLKTWFEDPDSRQPFALLGTGMFGFGLLLMVLSRHLGFFQDEYFWILHRRSWNVNAFWVPHNGHLSVVPVTIYKLLFITVGLQHTWPYRLILVGLHLLCVLLIYVLAARRAGRWIALIPAFLLLLLGAGYEDLLWAFQIGFVGSLAAGLGALLCLEQEGRRRDIAAAVLVSVSLGSSSVGLAVAVAILAKLVITRSPWRRLSIALGPLALYILWYLHFGTNEASLSNVPLIPSVDLETGAYGFAGFGGLTVGFGQILLAVAIAYLLARFWRGRTLPALTIAGVLGALAFWTLTALTRAQYHEPGASRYVYPSAVFILIGAIGMLQWRRFPLRIWALFGLVIAAAGLSNLGPLTTYAKERTQVDAEVRDALGAAQMAGPAGAPSFLPDAHHLPWLHLGEYLAAVKQLGSPAFTPAQIAAQPEGDRELADSVIIDAEGLPLEQPGAKALQTAAPVPIDHMSGLIVDETTVAVNTPCTRLTPSSPGGYATVVVAPGRALYLSMHGEGQVTIYVRRLAHHMPSQPLHVLQAAGAPALLQFPHDASTLPWRVRLVPTTRTAVCLI